MNLISMKAKNNDVNTKQAESVPSSQLDPLKSNLYKLIMGKKKRDREETAWGGGGRDTNEE